MGEEDIVTFYIGGAPTAEEILKLFLEDGEEISFEGCVLPAKLSIDEQDHEIRSFLRDVSCRRSCQLTNRITKSAVLKSMSSGINTEKQGRKGRTSRTEVSFFCGHTKECLNSDIVKGRLA